MILDGTLALLITGVSGVLTVLVVRGQPREVRAIIWFSFWLHIGLTLANLWITRYVYSRGDMYVFHKEGMQIADWIRTDPSLLFDVTAWTAGFPTDFRFPGGSEGTRMMVGLASLLCLVTADSFFGVSYLPAMAGFFAKLGIFTTLRDRLGRGQRRLVAFAILCFPTSVYWTVGLIKEAVALCCLGLVAVGLHNIKRAPLRAGLFVLAGGYWLQIIKGHFLVTGLLALAVMLYWFRSTEGGRLGVRPIYLVLAVVSAVAGMFLVGEIAPRFALDNLANEISFMQERRSGGSKINLGVQRDMGTLELVQLAPLALFTGLFRPTLLDVTSGTVLLNAIEATLLLVLSIRAVFYRGLRGMFAVIVRYPIVMFLLVFSMFSALGIGLATGNLGTMSRFRAPIMPFFVLAVLVFNSSRLPMHDIEPARTKKRESRPGVPARTR